MKSISFLFLILLSGSFLAACLPTDAPAPSPTPPACTPAATTPNPNGHRSNIEPEVEELYSRLEFVQANNFDPALFQGVKNDAFSLLRDRVGRWSSSNDIYVGNYGVIRITMTFISPELAQIIILNHQLSQQVLSKEEMQKKLREEMDTIAEREELIFLVTIAYSQYGQNETEENMVVLDIPLKTSTLINANGRRIEPHHLDPPLENEIVVSRGPLSGYIAFPIGILDGNGCSQIIQHRWNTTLAVSVDGVLIQGEPYEHPLTWFVKYHPLIEVAGDRAAVSYYSTAPSSVAQSHQPPSPRPNVPANREDIEYWERMAIHVWGYTVYP